MIIEKMFSSSEDQEKIYSVLLSEEELRLYSETIVKKVQEGQNNSLSLDDQNYLSDIDSKIRLNRRLFPISGASLGGAAGIMVGIKKSTPKIAKRALIGGATGALTGAYGIHEFNKHIIEPNIKEKRIQYVRANSKDRAHIRKNLNSK